MIGKSDTIIGTSSGGYFGKVAFLCYHLIRN